jgi:hypothetical protein
MSAAELGGDVGGTDQVPMPLEPAVRTGEPAPAWLGDALAAGRAGRGRPPLLDHAHPDPGLLGLVAERSGQVGAAPGVLAHDRVGVDDAKVHPSDLIRVTVVLVNGHRGGDGEPQPACVVEQGTERTWSGG